MLLRFKLDLVNFAFHTLFRLVWGSSMSPSALAMWFALRSLGPKIETLTVFFSRFTSQVSPFPNFWKVLLNVLSLNFLAKVKAQDSVISHTIHSRADLFPTKS